MLPTTGLILFLALLGQATWWLALVWLALLVETGLTVRRAYAQFTETGALKDSVVVENRLNVPVRIDYQGPHYGRGIERVADRTCYLIELEHGAILTFRREGSGATLRRETVHPGLTVVVQDERPGRSSVRRYRFERGTSRIG